MARTKLSEYSTTNSDNTDIENINIAEGCAPSGINNAIRELMVHLKEFQTGASGDAFTFAGGTLMSGTNTISGAAIISGNINSSGTNTFSGSNVMSFSGGSSASPSIYFASDTNTGIFSPAADTIAFTEGGAEAMRIDSSGNVGIGVTPSAWTTYTAVQIGAQASLAANASFALMSKNWRYDGSDKYIATAPASQYYQDNNGAHVWRTAASGTAGNTITFTQAMTLDASGRLGVGLTSLSAMLSIKNSSSTGVADFLLANDAGINNYLFTGGSAHATTAWRNNLVLYTGGAQDIVFNTNATERARITSGGDFLVAKTAIDASTVGFEARTTGVVATTRSGSTNDTDTLVVYSTGASAYRFYVGMGGTVFATNTTISAISDQRFKENVLDLDAGLSEIMALKPRKFDWKEGKGKDIKNDRGFIAQEFEQVFPDLVDEWKDPAPEGEEPYKSVRQDLIPVLVKAIQELKAELDTANTRLAALENK